ncbi:MAG TPA: hypothetical protein VNA16_00140, partial [Abditibacteriaceae bacterium]|nr:hypothetical protein [Abditibacteriaceae bacterium]
DYDKFAIIFKGIIKPPTDYKNWEVRSGFRWKGNTSSSDNLINNNRYTSWKKMMITKTSGGGITTITLPGHSFKIKDAGPTLVFGSQTFDVSASRKVFVVDKEGRIRIQP